MIPKKIHLIRHAEAEHNVNYDNWSFPDALLTPNGERQCLALNQRTRENIQTTAKLLVSSPMRRTLQTSLRGLPELIERLGGKSSLVVLDSLQENGSTPADTGSSRSILESFPEFEGIDFSSLDDQWNSKTGYWASDHDSLRRRAQCSLAWLANRKEDEIVVVSHGGALRYLTEDYKARYVSLIKEFKPDHYAPTLLNLSIALFYRHIFYFIFYFLI
ncbi:histidine phosphatase superfamily [Phakopsora pachyrhizi]|nr:histidine phosphatase superfamily [Phakopsora pachyrhizi]